LEAGIAVVPMDGAMGRAAVKAFADYGEGQGHKAQLNLADCFLYACAKVLGEAFVEGAGFFVDGFGVGVDGRLRGHDLRAG